MKIVKAINIHSAVDKVKDSIKPFEKEANKKYVSLEDARLFVFNLEQELKRHIEEGVQRAGWCSIEKKYMNDFIGEVFHPTYKELQED